MVISLSVAMRARVHSFPKEEPGAVCVLQFFGEARNKSWRLTKKSMCLQESFYKCFFPSIKILGCLARLVWGFGFERKWNFLRIFLIWLSLLMPPSTAFAATQGITPRSPHYKLLTFVFPNFLEPRERRERTFCGLNSTVFRKLWLEQAEKESLASVAHGKTWPRELGGGSPVIERSHDRHLVRGTFLRVIFADHLVW